MSDGMSEAYCGTYFKDRSKTSKKQTNKYKNPKGTWLNLKHPTKTMKNKKKELKTKRIKNY
ncbi:hypothetical protein PSOL_04310 [Candidatus Phytoplasma solani]|uniref:hypothetical protein n=1 Tax=Candidatus Phytoplasma solani TaxID=69896 RepID=UPI0032D9B354